MKKIAEQQLAKENEVLGALAMIGNAVTEKADTRNWQTLPAQIKYTRVPINTVSKSITLQMKGSSTQQNISLPIDKLTKKKNQLIFYHSPANWGI